MQQSFITVKKLWCDDKIFFFITVCLAAILPMGLLGKAGTVLPLIIGQCLIFFYSYKKNIIHTKDVTHIFMVAVMVVFSLILISLLSKSDMMVSSLLVWGRSLLCFLSVFFIYKICSSHHSFYHGFKFFFLIFCWFFVVYSFIYLCFIVFIDPSFSHALVANKTRSSLCVLIGLILTLYFIYTPQKNLSTYICYLPLFFFLVTIISGAFFLEKTANTLSKATLLGLMIALIAGLMVFMMRYVMKSIRYSIYFTLCIIAIFSAFYYGAILYDLDLGAIYQENCVAAKNATLHEGFMCMHSYFKQHHFIPIIDAHRVLIWSHVLDYISHDVLLGVGVDRINHQLSPSLPNYVFYLPAHPHNWILELTADTGIVVTFITLALMGYCIYYLAEHYIHSNFHPILFLMVLIIYYVVSSLANYSMWAYWWMGSNMVAIAILWSLWRWMARQE